MPKPTVHPPKRAPKQAPKRPRMLVEELEPRILYSADAAALLAFGGAAGTAEVRRLEPLTASDGATASPLTTTPASASASASASAPAPASTAAAAAPAAAARPQQSDAREIIFIDSRVPDAMRLADTLMQERGHGRMFDIVMLHAGEDGIAQMNRALAGEHDLAALHIISHGSAGALQIGNRWLDADALSRNAAAVAAWGQSLGADGDLLLYGCDAGQGAVGRAFIDQLAQLTGADVAASDNRTGSAALGGDWVLEVRAGSIETGVALSTAEQAAYAGALPNAAPVLDNSKSPALAAQRAGAGAPSGAVGTLVSSLVDFAVPAGQVDNITDVDGGALLGIAVTAADAANGSWHYSTNNGTSWNAMGTPSAASSRLLSADANTRIYFQPNANYSGTLSNAVTFRAWDRTSGSNGAVANTTSNGGTTAFSSASDSASLLVKQAATITAVETADLDSDGFIDALHIYFSEAIVDSTVIANDFNVAGVTGEAFSSTTGGDTANDADIYITFTDGLLNTAATPNLSYTADGATDANVSDAFGIEAANFDNGSSWWNTSWLNRSKITFNNTSSSENLTDYPMLVRLDASQIDFAKIKAGGADLRFVDGNGAALDYEIDTWDDVGETASVWVRVPQVDQASNTDFIYAYYNNTAAADGQDAPGVWNLMYGVWHLDDDPGPGGAGDIEDSDAPANDGTAEASMTSADLVAGRIGNAIDFDGVNDYIDVGSVNFGDDFTISAWVKPDSTGTLIQAIAANSSTGINSDGWRFFINSSGTTDGKILFETGNGSSGNAATSAAGVVNFNQWNHIAVTVNRSSGTATIYLNGVDVTVDSSIRNDFETATSWGIGRFKGGGCEFTGVIDEFRVDYAIRSAERVEADYLAQNGAFAFNSVGSAQVQAVATTDKAAPVLMSATTPQSTGSELFQATGQQLNLVFSESLGAAPSELNLEAALNFAAGATDADNLPGIGSGANPIGLVTTTLANDTIRITFNTNNTANANALRVGTHTAQVGTGTFVVDAAGITASTSAAAVTITGPANSAPVLDNTKTPVLTAQNEDSGAPSGAVGTLVSSLVDFAVPAGQVDNVTDANSAPVSGIAITAADVASGSWFYSTDNGASWNVLGTPSPAASRLLAADANTRIYFQPTANYNGTVAAALTFRAWDRTSGANGGTANTTTNGGTTAFSTATDTASLTIAAVNDAPVLDNTRTPVLAAQAEDSGAPSGAVGTLVSSLVDFAVPAGQVDNITDIDTGPLLGIAITAVDAANGSWFYSTNGGTTWNALGTPSAASSRLLAADANTRIYFQPNADYNGALPTAITFRAWDQTSGSNGGTADTSTNGGATAFSAATDTASLTITAVADAPVLDSTKSPALTAQNEDSGAPVGAVGTLVSSLVDFAAPAGQVDNVTDGDSGALLGIAITAADTTNGSWFFSTNNGTSWTALGTPTAAASRLLAADASTRIYFQPTGNYNGTVGTAITFRAWDRTSGTNGNTASTVANGGTTAFSSATDTASLTINPVNDAPVLNNARTPVLTAQAEDSGAPSGAVGTLVSSLVDFAAPAGQVDNITDIDSAALLGIAITAADVANGSWFYSTDNGTIWNALGTPSAASSRLLAADASTRIYFQPNANYTGTLTTAITFRAWDQASGSNGGTADTSTNGGITAYSSATDTASLTINAVADAPVLDNSKSPTLTAQNEDSPAPVGAVGTLVSSLVDFAVPAGQVDNVTDGDTGALLGIAITAADTANGSWFYSTNSGTTWNALGTPSDAASRLLAANGTTRIYFQPNANYNGSLATAITFRAWDQTSGVNGGTADTTTNGGTTAFSTATDTASLTITAVNDAPVLDNTKTPVLAAQDEDSGAPVGAVGTLVSSLVDFAAPAGEVDNVTDIDSGPLLGIAVTTVTTGSGSWHYSTDNGTSWNAMGTPSAAVSRLLAADANTRIYFQPNANYNGTQTLTIRAWDRTAGANGGTASTVSNGGITAFSSATDTANLVVNPINDAPTATNLSAAETYTEDTARNLTNIVVSDVDSATVTATLTLSNAAAGSLNTGTSGAVTSTYNAGTGVWSASGAIANVNTLLAALTFTPALNFNANFTIATSVSDVVDGSLVNSGSKAMTGTAVNDAPVLDNTKTPALAAQDEDSGAPVGAVGTLVSSLVDFAVPAGQVDNITDIDSGPLLGIAVTTVTTGSGSWHYSTDNGSTWNAMGTPSAAASRLLAADANTRIYFQPSANYNGTQTLTFRAWDRTAGSNGGTANTSTNGGITAYSSATDTANLVINAVADAPVLDNSKSPTLTAQNEDSPAPVGAVGTLVSSLVDFAVPAGQVDNVTDGDTGALLGIAITAADTANGSWFYSTNSGTTWNALGTPSDAASRLLAANGTTRIYFQPNANYNGSLATAITFRAWDQTSGVNGGTADTTTNGGTTAFSTATDSASLTITAVNDAPVLDNTKTPVMAAQDEDSGAPVGAVGTLVSSLVDFAAPAGEVDNVTDIDSGPLLGIAVTTVTTGNGSWHYSTDNGTSWNAMGTPSAAVSRLLAADANTRIYFQPNANYNGTQTLTFRAWDRTAGANGGTANTSTNGGTTAFSSAIDTANLVVNPVNDAPTATNLSAVETYTEDTARNLTDIVVGDVDSATVTATLTLSNAAAGSLNTGTSGAVTSTYNAGTGVWSASGAIANVNTLLAALTFTPALNFNANFTIATSVSDVVDGSLVNSGSKAMTGTAVNDAPVLDNTKTPVLAAQDEDSGAPVGAVGTLVSSLVDFAAPAGEVDNVTEVDSGALLGIAITAADAANGSWFYSTDNGTSWNALGTPSAANSRLLAADAGTRIYFQPNANYNGTLASAITFRAWDQTSGANGGLASTVANGGTTAFSTATDTASLVINAVNDAPTATNLSAAETYTEDAALNLTNIVIGDIDSASVTATLTLSNAAAGSLNTGTSGAVTSTYNAGTGVWSASGAIADVNTLLAALTFTPALDFNGNFTLATEVGDGSLSVSGSKAMTGTAVNDAPVLDNTGAMSLAAIDEDESGNAGTSIAAIVASAGGNRIGDVDAGALEGIALTAVAAGNGVWQYSTDSGANWSAVGAVSNASALLLTNDAQTFLRFVPNANWNGTEATGITFRAWDRTSGVEGGTADTTVNGGTTAFSSATETASIVVSPVNDAPTLGDGTLAAVAEDTVNPSGQTLATIFAGQFADIDAGAGFGGVAVVGNSADALTQGSWQYSSNAGGNWFAIGTVDDGAAALALSSSTLVRFVPAADYHGTPPGLTVRGLDDSHAGGFSSSAGSETRVTVDTTTNGGSSAIAAATAELSTSVTTVNDAPVLAAIGNRSVDEDATLSFTASAGDVDVPAQTLTYSLDAASLALGMTIDANTGAFSWTPSEAQGGLTPSVTITVTDNGTGSLLDSETFTITVNDTNLAPVLAVIGNRSTDEGATLSFTASGTDADLPGQTLTYSLDAASLALGMTIDATTGVFSWTPSEAQGGLTPSVTITVTDNGTGSLFDSETFTITVNDTNLAPVLAAIGDRNVDEGVTLNFTASATDADLPGQTLTYSLDAASLVLGMTIDANTGVFSWTPTEAQGGLTPSVTITVTDNGTGNLFDSETFTIAVNDTNLAPVLAAIGDRNVDEGATLSFTASATDADLPGQTLTYSLDAASLALGMTIDANTGVFSWTPSEAQGGLTPSVTITVTDNGTGNLFDSETFTITVDDTNLAPVLASIGDRNVDEGVTLSFSASASDADLPGQTLTYSLDAASLALGMTIDVNTGVFSWTPSEAQGGLTPSVTITVADNGTGSLTDSETFTITVNDTNLAPVLASIGNRNVDEGVTLSFTASATDADLPGQTLTYSLDAASLALGMTIDANTGAFSWVPTEAQGGLTPLVTITVTDNGTGSLFDSETFTITVNDTNLAPVLAAIGNRNVDEGVTLSFTASATDADLPGQSLTYSLDAASLALGMTIDANTGVFTWTPSEAQGGLTPSVTITVTDNGTGSLTDSETFTITVNDTNLAPVLAAIGNRNVDEGVTLSFTASATDADLPGQTLTYSLDATSLALGMTINANTGVLTWTPSEAQGGLTPSVTITVTDNGTGSLFDSETFIITVNDTNFAPVLAAIGDRNVDEGTTLSFTASATDADLPGQTLTYSLDAASLALGMTIDANTGVFSWTPTEAQGGLTPSVTITATDNGTGSLTDSETFTITVNDTNLAPVLAAIGDRNVDEGVTLSFTASATDADLPGQTLTYSLDATSLALGMTIDANTGVFSWTPTEAQGGLTPSVTITVTDNGTGSLFDSETFTITVNDTNLAPVLAAIGDRNVDEGVTLNFTASGTDADLPGQSLTYSLDAASLALGMTIDANTGVFTWTPSEAQGGLTPSVTITVTDNGTGSLFDSETFIITVNDTNLAPVLAAIGDRNVNEGTTLSFTASATDADLPGQTLTYSLDAASLALGMTIDANTGVFSWTPTEAQGGLTPSVTITVTDNGTGSLTDSETFTITVNDTNLAPVLAAIGDRNVDEGVTLSFTASATDADLPGQTLTYSLDAASLALGMTIDANTGVFSWTPTEAQGGLTPSVTITVTDNGTGSLFDSETFTITVNDTNLAPVLAAIGDRNVNEGTTLSFTASATDADLPGQTLTYSLDAASLALGMTIDANTGVFSWTPTEAQGGLTPSVTITVTDNGTGSLTDSETFTITVNDTNLAPVLAAIGDRNVDEGVTLSFTASATDADLPGQTLTYSLDAASLALGMTIDANTGVFSWTPTEAQGGLTPSVTITVTDNGTGNLTGSETFTIAVNDTNLAPVLAAIGNQSIDEGATLTFIASATDADLPGQTLTYSLDAASLALGMTIDANTGVFSWAPAEAQGGLTPSVTITVTDNGTGNLSDSVTFTITVADLNRAPVLAGIGNQSIDEGATLNFTASATDADLPGQTLTYSLDAASLALGMTIDANTGVFTWTPSEAQGGLTPSVTITVTDSGTGSLSDSATFTITVAELDSAPVTTPVSLAAIDEDSGERTISQAELLARASDADGQNLRATGLTIDSGYGTLVDNGNGSWTYTPAPNDDTAVRFSYTVTDGSLTAAGSATLDIVAVNDAPTIGAASLVLYGHQSLLLDSTLLRASDPDNAAASLSFVVNEVRHARFEWAAAPGVAIAQFTQADVEAGRVRFVSTSTIDAPTFRVTAFDGQQYSAEIGADIAFNPVAVQPTDDPTSEPPPAPAKPAEPAPSAPGAAPLPASPVAPAATQPGPGHGAARPDVGPGSFEPAAQYSASAAATAQAGASDPARPRARGGDLGWSSFETVDDYLIGMLQAQLLDLSMPPQPSLHSTSPGNDSGAGPAQATDEEQSSIGLSMTATAQATGLALTAGTVWWALRAGGLLSSLLASLPAWRHADLLAVLPDEEDDDEAWDLAEDDEAERDEHAVGQLLEPSLEGSPR